MPSSSKVFTAALASAPFPDGTDGAAFADPSVTFVVPNHFNPEKTFDIVVYFHGWWTEIATQYPTGDSDANQTIWYGLDDQIGRSQRNVLLIAPQLPKKAANGSPGKLAKPGAAARLLAEARDVVANKISGGAVFAAGFDAAPVIVASYSGGYRAAACFVAPDTGVPRRVKAVFMLDSLYGKDQKDDFVAWIKASGSRSVFVSLAHDTQALTDNTWLLSRELLQAVGVDVNHVPTSPPGHLSIGETMVYRVMNAEHFKIPVLGPPVGPLTWFLDTLPAIAPATPMPTA